MLFGVQTPYAGPCLISEINLPDVQSRPLLSTAYDWQYIFVPMTTTILTVNTGSSSVRLAVFIRDGDTFTELASIRQDLSAGEPSEHTEKIRAEACARRNHRGSASSGSRRYESYRVMPDRQENRAGDRAIDAAGATSQSRCAEWNIAQPARC